jgi:hypothetical protein
MSILPRHRALAILDECTGDHIWSLEHCVLRGVPQQWIDQLSDIYESGFRSDTQTIYTDKGVTNQYRGIRDVDLALRAGRELGIDVDRIASGQISRIGIVTAIKNAVSDGE